MSIVVNLDVMLARRKMRSKELAEHIGITEQNVSLLKSGKVKGIRFGTLDRICAVLNCQPGDIPGISPWERRRFTKHGTGLTALIFGNAFFAVVSLTNSFCAIQLFARGVTEGDCDGDSRFSVLDRYWARSQSAPSLTSWAACHMRSTSRL